MRLFLSALFATICLTLMARAVEVTLTTTTLTCFATSAINLTPGMTVAGEIQAELSTTVQSVEGKEPLQISLRAVMPSTTALLVPGTHERVTYATGTAFTVNLVAVGDAGTRATALTFCQNPGLVSAPGGLRVTREWRATGAKSGECRVTLRTTKPLTCTLTLPAAYPPARTCSLAPDVVLDHGRTFGWTFAQSAQTLTLAWPMTFLDACPAAYYPPLTVTSTVHDPAKDQYEDNIRQTTLNGARAKITIDTNRVFADRRLYRTGVVCQLEEVTDAAPPPTPERIVLARFRYSGRGAAWNAYHEGLKKMYAFTARYLPCAPDIAIMNASALNATLAPGQERPTTLYIFADENFALSTAETLILRNYLDAGGMLFIDSRYDPLIKSIIANTFRSILPDAELNPINRQHALTTHLFILSSPGIGLNLYDPTNYGLTYQGHLAVFCTQGNFANLCHQNPLPAVDGTKQDGGMQYILAQYQMVANVFAYAVTQGDPEQLARLRGKMGEK